MTRKPIGQEGTPRLLDVPIRGKPRPSGQFYLWRAVKGARWAVYGPALQRNRPTRGEMHGDYLDEQEADRVCRNLNHMIMRQRQQARDARSLDLPGT